jgi:hypothetical protein
MRFPDGWLDTCVLTPTLQCFSFQLFLRGKPHLQNYMRRLPKTHKKLPMKKKNEPDFYKLDQINPLPQIHEAPIPGAAATVQAMRAGPPPPGSSANGDVLPLGVGAPMTQSHMDNPLGIVTPNMSPNHGGASIIGGGVSDNYAPLNHTTGSGMSGMRSSMNSYGNMNSMGMSSMNSMSHDNMGMGGMNGMSSMSGMNGLSSMSGMNSMSMNGMSGMSGGMGNLGMGSSSMNHNYLGSMGTSNMNMHGGQSGIAGSLNSRYNSYNDSMVDSFIDDYDCMPSQAMMGLGGSQSRSQQPQHTGLMMGDYGESGGYDKMAPLSHSNNIRRPIPMRQGPSLNNMGGGLRNETSQRQPEFYSGYSNQPSSIMSPSMQNDIYGRGGSSSLPSLQDEYASPSSSNSNSLPLRPVEN